MPEIPLAPHPFAKQIEGSVTAPAGFSAAGVVCGIKHSGKKDLAIIASDRPAAVAGLLTSNRVRAACVDLTRQTVDAGVAQAIVCNSGNANCYTGPQGLQDAEEMCRLTAGALNLPRELIIGASTGVIGTTLPMDRIRQGIDAAADALSTDGGPAAAEAILTTDLVSKTIACEFEVGGGTIRIGAAAKGSGMIEPNLATMFCFITTDAQVDSGALQTSLKAAVNQSFNCLTVDSDTSTNDMVLMLANGASGVEVAGSDMGRFQDVLNWVCREMAKSIAADGEGATTLVEVRVTGAAGETDARLAAKTIANSPLVKTAIFGKDPNWGRILAAAGRSGAEVDQSRMTLRLGDETIVEQGQPRTMAEDVRKELMGRDFLLISLDLGLGTGESTVWTCDFSYDYIKINAEYHT